MFDNFFLVMRGTGDLGESIEVLPDYGRFQILDAHGYK
jgi:hypothetical protein